MVQKRRVSFMSGGRSVTFFARPRILPVNVGSFGSGMSRSAGRIPLTKKQIRGFRKVRKQLDQRGKELSKKHGVQVEILDLNPHFTRGNRIPKSAITKEGKPVLTMGEANTRKKIVFVDERVPRSGQNRVVQHEKEHIENPRATEEQIEENTQRKHGFRQLPRKLRRKAFRRLSS